MFEPSISSAPTLAALPAGACDSHVHVFDPATHPYAVRRAYTAPTADTAMLRAFLERLGLDRAVLVQPSPYGTDNRCLLAALAALGPERARGVAVIDPEACDRTAIAELYAAGVRGLRLNLEAAGERRGEALTDALGRTGALAREFGFFVQVYADLALIAAAAGTIEKLDVPVVLDHFAGARAERGLDQPGLAALRGLLAGGRTWIKLSAPYRASAQPDHADLAPLARELIALRPDRMVWASDWPHTGGGQARRERATHEIEPFREIDDALALARLRDWAGDDETFQAILVRNPAALFGF